MTSTFTRDSIRPDKHLLIAGIYTYIHIETRSGQEIDRQDLGKLNSGFIIKRAERQR